MGDGVQRASGRQQRSVGEISAAVEDGGWRRVVRRGEGMRNMILVLEGKERLLLLALHCGRNIPRRGEGLLDRTASIPLSYGIISR